MSGEPKTYNQIAGLKISRIEAITDGVFAVAMTLLVLDIKAEYNPQIKSEAHLISFYFSLLPKFLSYFMSFMTLGIFWTGHSAQYAFIARSDRHLNWIALLFLMCVSVIPFTTAFLSDYTHFKFAFGLYWLNIFLLGITLLFHWQYACTHGYLSIAGDELIAVNKAIRHRIITAQLLYAGAALLCFVNVYVSIALITGIQLNYALAAFFSPKAKK